MDSGLVNMYPEKPCEGGTIERRSEEREEGAREGGKIKLTISGRTTRSTLPGWRLKDKSQLRILYGKRRDSSSHSLSISSTFAMFASTSRSCERERREGRRSRLRVLDVRPHSSGTS